MPSRMEKHEQVQISENRRINKNQSLYQEMKNNTTYHEVETIEPVITKENFSIEDIQKEPERRRRSISKESITPDTLSSLLMMQEKKEYDINKVLKEAKETRVDKDELEQKRSLKKKEYNIVNEINLDKLDEIKEKRKNTGVKETEDAELKELIDTIYSKTLKEELKKAESEVVVQEESIESGEDDGDLLSELLPTSSEETIINENLSKKIVEEEKKKQSKKIENSFFTTSMELSTDDMIDVDDDEVETYEDFLGEDKRLPIWSIILIILGVLITLGGIIYFLLTSFM